MKKLFFLSLLTFLLIFTKSLATQPLVLAGEDRYETSFKVNESLNKGSDALILVSGHDYKSQVIASSLSEKLSSRLYYLKDDNLDKRIEDLAKDMRIRKIYLFEGEKNFSEDIKNKLRNLKELEIISLKDDKDQIDINRKYFREASKAILISKENYADGISAVSLAINKSYPIYLIDENNARMIGENLKKDGIKESIIVAGPSSLSFNLEEFFPNPIRICGPDRYETSLNLFEKYYPKSDSIVITKGDNFADAILSGPVSYQNSTITLLVKEKLSDLDFYNLDYKRLTVVGGRLDRVRKKDYDKVLYLSPHQDDELVFFAPAIREDLKAGKEVYIALLTNGEKTGAITLINEKLAKDKKIGPIELIKARNLEFKHSCMELGIKKENIFFFGYTNLAINEKDVEDSLKSLRKKLGNDILIKALSPYKYELNRDHSLIGRVTKKFAIENNLALYLFGGDYNFKKEIIGQL